MQASKACCEIGRACTPVLWRCAHLTWQDGGARGAAAQRAAAPKPAEGLAKLFPLPFGVWAVGQFEFLTYCVTNKKIQTDPLAGFVSTNPELRPGELEGDRTEWAPCRLNQAQIRAR